MNTKTSVVLSDEKLWGLACEGDREAFTRIVERYQSLVCSIAYSACGVLGASEDMAQETFITAWHRLKELREPSKLRQWLCGIVRNIAANTVRRELRRGGEPEPLEAIEAHPSSETDPATQSITREEETLLWRTLSGMPESYREPLVLFYREEKSVAEVALQLDLTEDTVRQRLSRGRAMLREEVTALVESTLSRTKPGTAFTVGVLVALPMVSASSATAAITAGTVAKTGVAGKGILAKLGFSAFLGPVIGLLFAYFGTKAAASTARSKAERDYIIRYTWSRIIPFCLIMSIGLAGVLSQAGKLYTPTAPWIVLGVSCWTGVLVGGIMMFCRRLDRSVQRIRTKLDGTREAGSDLLAPDQSPRQAKYFESKLRFLGLPLFAIAWAGINAERNRPRTVCGWLAVGEIAVSPLLAFGGVAIAPIAIGAVTIGVLSLSLFWGIAVGVLAVGSLAFGWWALGCAAAGIKCAAGFAAWARDFAVGLATTATEAGTTRATEWVKTEWFADFNGLILQQAHWWIVVCLGTALVLRVLRVGQVR